MSEQNSGQHSKDNESGATAVEYGLLVALVAAVIAVIVGLLGVQLGAIFTNIVGAF